MLPGESSELLMSIKNLFFLLFTLTISFLQMNCKKDSVTSPQDNTPDSTSHEFTWQLDTLGDGNSSILYDVAVINDTLAYAVGELYLKDSTGKFDPLPYNAAKWDGKKWRLQRVTVNFRGNFITPPLYGIFAFSSTQIWLVGGLAICGDGQTWTPYDVRMITGFDTLSFTECWGNNYSQMYFSGLHGSLVHYNGTTWQKIESGTTLDIQDIWGSKNTQTGETEILAVASYGSFGEGKKLLSIKNNSVTSLSDSGLPSFGLGGIWFETNKKYYITAGGIHTKTSAISTVPWDTLKNISNYSLGAIRGTEVNNIIATGDFGECVHYNGKTWRNYPEIMIDGFYSNISMKNKAAALCGSLSAKAVVIIGRQQ